MSWEEIVMEYPEELLGAIKRNPENSFVKSVKEFYERVRYITEPQSHSLCCIGRPKKRRARRSYAYCEQRCGEYSEQRCGEYPGDYGMDWWK